MKFSQLEIDASGIEKATQQVSFLPKLYPQAAKLALRRALEAMRTEMAEKTSELYYMKSSEVKKSTVIKDLGLIVRGRRKNLIDYMLAPRKVPRKRINGLWGAVKKAGGLKHIPRGFLIATRGKTLGYLRYAPGGKDKWQGIKPISAPSVAQIVKNPEVLEATMKRGQKVFEERMRHEMLREMGMIK